MMETKIIKEIYQNYRSCLPLSKYIHSKLRIQIGVPFDEYINIVPREGKILSLGCGLGFLEYYLARDSDSRYILATDNDKSRISIAKNAARHLNNIDFKYLNVQNIDELKEDGIWDAVIVNDLLHHVSYSLQEKTIINSSRLLKEDGVLIIKDVDARPDLFRFCNTLNDKLLNGLKHVYYRREDGYRDLLKKSMLRSISIKYFMTFPFKNVMILAKHGK